MRVEETQVGLIIIPETAFESEYIRRNFQNQSSPRISVATRGTTCDIIGLDIDFTVGK